MNDAQRKPGQRPAHVKAPEHWGKGPPVPTPDCTDKANSKAEAQSPTRYGDWEHKGIAVDF
jgi:hypothetical protein